METNNKNEIDLIELSLKIYLYFRKYFWVFLIAIVIGFVFALIKNKYMSKEYESSMILSIKTENNYMYAFTFDEKENKYKKNHIEIIDKLISSINSQIISGNISGLSKKMLIPAKQLKNIKSIKSDNNNKDDEEYCNIYKIDVTIKDTGVLNYLGAGIEYFVNNNSYIKKQLKSDSLFLTSVISKIEFKIIELDNLQKQISGEIFNQSNIALIGNRSHITESIQLVSLKEKLQSELNNLNKIEIVEDFYIPVNQSTSLIKDLIFSVAIMLFISFIIIFFIILNNKAKQYKNNRLS